MTFDGDQRSELLPSGGMCWTTHPKVALYFWFDDRAILMFQFDMHLMVLIGQVPWDKDTDCQVDRCRTAEVRNTPPVPAAPHHIQFAVDHLGLIGED